MVPPSDSLSAVGKGAAVTVSGVDREDTEQRWWGPVYREDDSLLAWWWVDGDARFLLVADAAGARFERIDLEVPGGDRILSVGPAAAPGLGPSS